MKRIAALTLMLLAVQRTTAIAEQPPAGVVEMFELDGYFGTLTRAASGVPRARPDPAQEALDRWRASAATFTHGFAVSRGANGTESFAARRVYEDEIGQAHVRLSQKIAGLPVVGAELIVHADVQTGKVRGINGRFAIDRGLPRSAQLRADDALASAMGEYHLTHANIVGSPELSYLIDDVNDVHLVWTNLVSYSSENGQEMDRIYADALTGAAVGRHPQVRRAKNREMYDCLGDDVWTNCVFLFSDAGGSSSDTAALAAFNNAGIAWDYFLAKHGRDGLEGVFRQGVHYGTLYNNAGPIPAGEGFAIVYGDGNNANFSSLAFSRDIAWHEFTHRVIAQETMLTANVEQRSIDEGLADVFAVAIDAYRDATADDEAADWWIAEDVYTPSVSNDALRYLDDPADQTGQRDYYPERNLGELEGPHKNAGITGLAFYMMVKGGGPPNARGWASFIEPHLALGMARAEKVFYRAIVAYMPSTNSMSFRKLREYTERAADDFYGLQEVKTVRKAWANVGNDWQTHTQQLGANSEWVSATYTTHASGYHTGQYQGSGSFKLYLERSTAAGWVVYGSSTGTSSVKLIETSFSSGVYRWRVVSNTASGSFTLIQIALTDAHPLSTVKRRGSGRKPAPSK